MPVTKSLTEWERIKGCLVSDVSPNKKMTEEEFDRLPGKSGVNFNDREKFLRDNGYEITRANLIDSSLSAIDPN
jgi:hypothetical protein